MDFSIYVHRLFGSESAILWKVAMPPVLYGLHGWIATRMAVAALFHPYETWYWPGTKIAMPLTPGIFPKRKNKLAESVAKTVTETLLTPDDISIKVESLVTQENLYLASDAFVDAVLKEFRDTTKLHRLASELAELSPAMLQHLVDSAIEGLEKGRDRNVQVIVEKIFDHMILPMRISLEQATEISSRIMEAFITPEKVRSHLITLLSPQNINALDESIQAHAGGPYKLLARIIGVKRVCYEWRNFMEKEPEESIRVIGDLIKRFGIRDQMAIQIANFDLRSMPLQNIAKLKANVVSFVENFLLHNRDSIMEAVKVGEGAAMSTVRSAIIRFNPESIPEKWLERTKHNVSTFAYSYLHSELRVLLGRLIPQLGIKDLITTKISQFSSEKMEELVKSICAKELQALEYFGGAIGVVLGFVQILINAIAP
ncbi:MAG: hypothetical protein DKT66_21900 [Candidatus Melainabacteria bacterium]|nr:MAG: hypothetical protein DKT66_21900 [Candidatus Melainabacteria bacterium]